MESSFLSGVSESVIFVSSVVTSTSSLWTTPRGMQRFIDGIGNSLALLSLRDGSNSSYKDWPMASVLWFGRKGLADEW